MQAGFVADGGFEGSVEAEGINGAWGASDVKR